MIKAYLALWNQLTATGVIKPTTHLLDNKVSAELKAEIKKNCTIQLAPPDNHRQNLAERATQIFKCHFKAIIAGVDESFPMRLWDKLLPQIVLTLNLLRQSNNAPKVSLYQYVHGNFDYNKMPLAPMGCAVQLFKSRDRHGTWAEHATNGWYYGTSTEHYRCHRIYVKKKKSKRISDRVFFKHKYVMQPTLMQADIIVKAINDLAHALKGRKNTKGIAQIEALEKIDEILNNLAKTSTTKAKQFTFDKATAPPHETSPTTQATVPTPRTITRPSITSAIIDKPITETSTLRVQATNEEPTVNKIPPPRVQAKPTKEPSLQQAKICLHICKATTNRARLQQHYTRQLRQQEQRERIQLIHNKDTGEFLNYHQLICDPKHLRVWSKSAANEFERLAQGVCGQVKGTNIIFFIKKIKYPKKERKT
jgi:hypothetical protein